MAGVRSLVLPPCFVGVAVATEEGGAGKEGAEEAQQSCCGAIAGLSLLHIAFTDALYPYCAIDRK